MKINFDKLIRLKESTFLSLLMQLGDKGLSWLSPLLVLYLFNSENEYVSLEYILSISLLALSFSDLGVRSYITFSGLKLEDKNLQKDVMGFIFLFSVIGLLIIILSYIGSSLLSLFDRTLTFVLIQTISFTLMSVYAQTIIVRGFPAFYSSINLVVKILTVGVLVVVYLLDIKLELDYFFLSNLVLISSAMCLSHRYHVDSRIDLKDTFLFIRKSLAYSWPLLISTLFSLIVMNLSKIYSFSSLDENVSAAFFFCSRIVFVIQLIHLSVSPLLMERIYKPAAIAAYRGEVTRIYTVAILLGCLCVTALYFLLSKFDAPMLDFVNFIILVLYTAVWCFNAFFETFYSSENRNKALLLYSSISVGIYGVLMILIKPDSVRILLLVMLGAGIVYNALLITPSNKGVRRRT